MVASCMPPTGDLACNPGMYPDWESNQRPFASQSGTQSTVPYQPGLIFLFLVILFFKFFIVQIQLSPFFPLCSPLPHSPPPPTLNPSPLWLCPWVLYTCSFMTLHLFPLLSPLLWLLLVCSYFNVSDYILLACLFC